MNGSQHTQGNDLSLAVLKQFQKLMTNTIALDPQFSLAKYGFVIMYSLFSPVKKA